VNKNINLKLNKNTNNKNIINYVRKPILVNSSLPLKTSINININIDNDTKNNSIKRNDTNERVISEYKDFIEKKNALPGHKNRVINVNKSNSININKKSRIFEIDIKKNYKDKKDKSSDKINLTKNIYKNDDNVNPYLDIQKILQGIEIEKEKRSVQGKQLEEEKNEIKKKLEEECNLYKNKSENLEKEILKLNETKNENKSGQENKNNDLQKEIDELKKKMNDKEKENNEIIKNLQEEARQAKFQLADIKYQADNQIMKYKNIVKKMSGKLESVGIKVKDIK
jgi:hypothetical protein